MAHNRCVKIPGLPSAQGLYDPSYEHDSCGVGFVVHVKGQRSHGIVEQALKVLINLLHRGACGCEANTGDGAGILIQMPDRFFRRESARLGFTLPLEQQYGAGFVFLPRDPASRSQIEAQKLMVNSPNHTVVYIPVGSMGVPLTGTFNATEPRGPNR